MQNVWRSTQTVLLWKTNEGDVDNKAARGINFPRLGPCKELGIGVKEITCHFPDCIVGCVNVVVRSTFTAETHGVIGEAGGAIGLALILH